MNDIETESQRNWGQYHKRLSGAGANAVILNHFAQLRVLHRNPLVHPERTLTMPEARSLWAMCESLIQAIVADIERKGPNPSADIVAMLPSEESGASASSGGA